MFTDSLAEITGSCTLVEFVASCNTKKSQIEARHIVTPLSVRLGLGNLGFESGTTSGFATIYPSLIYRLAKETSQSLNLSVRPIRPIRRGRVEELVCSAFSDILEHFGGFYLAMIKIGAHESKLFMSTIQFDSMSILRMPRRRWRCTSPHPSM
ncbi:hypothetical protein EDD85DRAFT_794109 [Armillaria nabsnona]|nr:hypothetical protein EDD85DRAFT_794109 [Armillaria nabsnona]